MQAAAQVPASSLLSLLGNAASTGAIRDLLDALPESIFLFDANERMIFQNALARNLFGFSAGESGAEIVTVEEFANRMPLRTPEHRAPIASQLHPLRRALRGETVINAVYLTRAGAGVPCWVELNARPIDLSPDQPRGTVLTCRDVTERRRKEIANQSAAQLHRFVYHENLAGIIHSTVDGRLFDCNDAMVRMLGYGSREELLGLRAPQIYYDPQDRDRMLGLLSHTRLLNEFEVRFKKEDGAICWALLNIRLLDPVPGQVGGSLVGTAIDITDRKIWEESLRQSERRFAAFMRNLPGVAFIKDLDGRYAFYNEASLKLFNLRPEEIVGRTDAEIWPDEIARHFRTNDAAVVENRQPIEIVEPVPHGNEIHHWLMYKFPILEDDRVVSLGGMGIDITERLHLEEQLTQSRKMEALGRLAGGIAHDFNNLLTVISGYGQLAQQAVGGSDPATLVAYLQEVLSASRRAAGLTGQLLAFSRRQNIKPEILDLGDLLRNMERLLERVIGEHVELNVRCNSQKCLILADNHQIEQVVMNLAVNARDAMPLGGNLEIECSLVPGPAAVHSDTQSDYEKIDAEVLLLVRDNGIGMDEGTRSHLFEPFFTSKAKGRGTGLGLSTVYGIVSQGGGRIDVESEPGRGSCFKIFLPAVGGSAVPAEGIASAPVSLAGTETVLLVEDELSVRSLTNEILKRFGYKVLVADSGRAALDIWHREMGKIDVLLTDVIMPLMSGGELAHKLRERNPRLRVLFMSGYTDDMLQSHGGLTGETQLLPKPFTAEALGRRLRDVLNA